MSATSVLPRPEATESGTTRLAQRQSRPRSKPAAELASVGRSGLLARAAAFVLGTIWLLIVLLPIYYMVLTSFRSQAQYLSANAWVPTGGLSLSSWGAVFSGSGLWGDFLRSLIYSAATIAVVAVLSVLSAFRIVRRASRFSAVSFRLLLFGLAVPIQALLIPIYVIMVKLDLYDTLYGLVLVTAASLIAVAVLLAVNYVRMIPRELFDAMAVDGATEKTVFTRLVWPMARPVIGVISIFAGLGSWNNFILPLVLTQSTGSTVLTLGLVKVSSTSSGFGVSVPVVMAGVVFSVLPLLFLYLALRRQFVKGIGGFAIR